jgi:ELWxxDGT repeat protein
MSRRHLVSSIAATLALASFAATAAAQPVRLTHVVANAQALGSWPSGLKQAGATLYFRATDGSGEELWKSDGTAAGTVLVKDILPGPESSEPLNLVDGGALLYFTATDGIKRTLWKSDGTEQGTAALTDVRVYDVPMVHSGGLLYFVADDGVNGRELWKSDGTAAGTAMVKNIRTGPFGGSNPTRLTDANGTLFFIASDTLNVEALWKTDGTDAGTVKVRDFALDDVPAHLTYANGFLHFVAGDALHGRELWKSDGTAAGTVMVKDIRPGTSPSLADNLKAFGGTLFFWADDGANGREMWRSDGTEGGTVLVKETAPGPASLGPAAFTEAGGVLYFFLADGGGTAVLWKSDGTAAGTVAVKAMAPPGGMLPISAIDVSGALYFVNSSGWDLWRSDGTEAGTAPVGEVVDPVITAFAGRIHFSRETPQAGGEPWVHDPAAGTTYLLKDLFVGVSNTPIHTHRLSAHGGTLLFGAEQAIEGSELWRTDGTAAGTSIVEDILPGLQGGFPIGWQNPDPGLHRRIGPVLYFRGRDAMGEELWRSDGTAAGTFRVKDIRTGSDDSRPAGLTNVGGVLFFTADDGISGRELWKSDGTPAGTVMVKDIGSGFSVDRILAGTHGLVFFTASDSANGRELWKSDGSEAGTVMVKDISPGPGSSVDRFLGTSGDTIFFSANDGSSQALWKSNGTSAGTAKVKDVAVLEAGPTAVVGGLLFFSSNANGTGIELWKSDGTEAGTVMVKDIVPGPAGSYPSNYFGHQGTLYFTAEAPGVGRELWNSDGTAAGTVRVKSFGLPASIVGGPTTSANAFAGANGVIYFAADDGTSGRELWRSDGTELGTYRLVDMFPGSAAGNPTDLTIVGDRLYFVANDGVEPRSLWYLPLADADPPRLGNISTRTRVLTGEDVMIGGFVIGGPSSKTVAIVATGPSLTAYGIASPLPNPRITLVRSSDQAIIDTNDDWQAHPSASQLQGAGFAPSNVLEAAILASLSPGAYTVIVEGAGGGTGVSVIGVYEVDATNIPLVNISTRGRVQAGQDVMIGGFIVNGGGPQTLAILATGPSLSSFGITSPLANPRITLVRSSDQAIIDTNDDWQAHANASQLSAAGFAPSNALESGIHATLQPGAYTVIVEGVGGGTGVAVIGVYRLP